MNRTSPAPQPKSSRLAVPFVALGAVAALLAYAAGRWSSHDAGGTPPEPAHAAPREADPARDLPAYGGSRYAGRAPAPPSAAPAAVGPAYPAPPRAASALVTPQGRPTPQLVARVTREVTRKLEESRSELIERCVPASRLAHGETSAKFTFNVTFDASGREIARGINEDRHLRAPEVASCLRKLPIGSLRVSAPGATVGVRVAMHLP
jgi:hypothetical protein